MQTIVFMIAGDTEYALDKPETFVQLTEVDALDLMRWLDLPAEDFGVVEANDLAARCRRRQWPLARNIDPAVPARSMRAVNSNLTYSVPAREEGYLRAKTNEILRLAERAGPDGRILFS